jgi:hypothetical protein
MPWRVVRQRLSFANPMVASSMANKQKLKLIQKTLDFEYVSS